MTFNDTTTNGRGRVTENVSVARACHRPCGPRPVRAFSLVEVMVVVVLMSFIVLALMAVFSSTQQAFKASMIQTDVLEGGRSAIDLMSADLRRLTPSQGVTNGAVNFCVTNDPTSSWLTNSLVGATMPRTNYVQSFFILTRGNEDGQPTWGAVGYAVVSNSSSGLFSLYRFSTNHHELAHDPAFLFTNDFLRAFSAARTNGSHLIDGVIHLTVRAYDTNGILIDFNRKNVRTNGLFYVQGRGTDPGYTFYSNTVPAAVEVEMAVLENRALQRAESMAGSIRDNYLAAQAGKVHVFRQRVAIPSVDPSGY